MTISVDKRRGWRKPHNASQNIVLIPYWLLLLFITFLLIGCNKEQHLQGMTMGTTWSIRAITNEDKDKLQTKIQNEMERIENVFSNWRKNSEVSKFNSFHSTAPFPISRDFYVVMNVSLQVASASEGALDPTLADLIDTSGFGVNDKIDTSPNTLKKLKKHTGWQKLTSFEKEGKYFLQKIDPNIKLNLSAVAKGYGVDAIYLLLKTNKIDNFLIEIGGEVRTAGLNQKDEPWNIGIEKPEPGKNEIYTVLKLSEMAVATSGGYRNFNKEGKKTNIHILNPTTGESVQNNILSVSIINPNCTYADALATAVMVLGEDKGLKLIEKFKYTDALILYQDNNKISAISTPGMKNYIKNTSQK